MTENKKNIENKKIISIYKSRETLLNILSSRGYIIDDYQGFDINDIHSCVNNNQLDMLVKTADNTNKVYIKYFLEKSCKSSQIYEIMRNIFTNDSSDPESLFDHDDLIIVIKDEPNDTIQKLQQTIYLQENKFITIININRLLFNILEHSYVPMHVALSEDEKQKIMVKYNITNDTQFPEISRFDPVAQVIGLRPGQLCEITRASKTAIISKFYRRCL
jgi:DNA-directed RNA polymerase subunit H (RpoH/RPB5)